MLDMSQYLIISMKKLIFNKFFTDTTNSFIAQ